MKKATHIMMIIATLIIAVSLFVACNDGQHSQDYTVRFETNGGSSVSSVTGKQIATEPLTTREDYDFAGWFDNAEFNGSRIVFPYTLSKDITLYAKWTEKQTPDVPAPTYKVTFVTNGGSSVSQMTVSKIRTEPITTRENHDFLGWYDNADFEGNRISFPYTVTKEITLYAKWQEMLARVWVQTTLADYETEQNEDGTVKVLSYKGNAENIILPTDENLTFERSFLYQEDNATIKAVCIPSNILETNAYWFAYASLEEIAVVENHPTFSCKNGVLFSKDETVLLAYPNSKPVITYEVPSSVKTVGYSAFNGNSVIEHIIVAEGVEKLDSVCFAGLSNLKTISLPSTLTETGSSCLIANPLLSEVEFPSTLAVCASDTFDSRCVGLKRIIAPAIMKTSGIPNLEYREINGGTEIPAGFCSDCPSLTTVVINCEIQSIGSAYGTGAFINCGMLKNINLPNSLTYIGTRTFANCSSLAEIEIPSNLTKIDKYAFKDCSALKRLILPEGLTQIGNYALDGSGLEEIYLPSSIQSFPAFDSVKNLTTLHCSADAITKLYKGTFLSAQTFLRNLIITSGETIPNTNGYSYGFCSLHTLVIPSCVKEIHSRAFMNCPLVQITNLSSVEWTPSVSDNAGQFVPSSAEIRRDTNTSFEGKITTEANGLIKYTYKDEVRILDFVRDRNITKLTESDFAGYTSIGDYAFYNCTSLEHVQIPSNIKNVGSYSFSGCINIKSLTIADGVDSIGNYAFSRTENLTSVTIPHSVTSIGANIFMNNSETDNLTITVIGFTSKPDGWNNSWYDSSNIVVKWNS